MNVEDDLPDGTLAQGVTGAPPAGYRFVVQQISADSNASVGGEHASVIEVFAETGSGVHGFAYGLYTANPTNAREGMLSQSGGLIAESGDDFHIVIGSSNGPTTEQIWLTGYLMRA